MSSKYFGNKNDNKQGKQGRKVTNRRVNKHTIEVLV